MSDQLPDPCSICGFDGRGLRPPDILATLRSLGRRWAGVLAGDVPDAARGHAEAALDGLLAADRPLRADIARSGSRPEAMADGIGAVADALADALEGPDDPFQREGVEEAALAAAHAGIHHLRLAEKGR